MLVLGGAGRVDSTVRGLDCAPRGNRRTRYPLPGRTLRKMRPPRASARLAATRRSERERSEIPSPGGRPVTYTCATLPCAVNEAAAPRPPVAAAAPPAVT